MSFRNTVIYRLVIVFSALWVQATPTGLPIQDTRTALAQNTQSPPAQQNHNGTSPIYNVYGAMINQDNITYSSEGGNIHGAEINQINIIFGNQGSDDDHGPKTPKSSATSLLKLNKMRKFHLKMEKKLEKMIHNQRVNDMSNTEQLDQMKDLLIKVKEECYLLTELQKVYRSYMNVDNLIAMECSSDKSYNVLEWILDAKFAVHDRLKRSHYLFRKLRQS